MTDFQITRIEAYQLETQDKTYLRIDGDWYIRRDEEFDDGMDHVPTDQYLEQMFQEWSLVQEDGTLVHNLSDTDAKAVINDMVQSF